MELHRHPQPQPHAVMFPYPAQGHINPMMQLATKLLSSGFFITFVNTDFNHQRMLDNESSRHLLQLPNLRFEHLPDGLPPSHGRFIQSVPECTAAILSLPEPFAQLVKKIMAGSSPPLTCIIADSFCSWMQDVADKFGVPRVSLWTTPVHANMVYHFQSILISQGYIPLKDKGKASHVITCIPGVVPMPLSEHISFFLVEDSSDYLFQWHLNQCMRRPNEAAWNLGNNFVDLENEAVEAFQKEAKNFLPIGPLIPQTLLKGKGCRGQGGLSVWAEEGGCEAWLAEQEERSVLYISFGSIASMGAEEVEEMVKGVEESGVPFLWAVRPDQEGEALKGLRRRLAAEEEAQKGGKRGMMVGWAPQLEVLAHTAVGAFLTHCGWNSVVESICAGVPILAKPGGFAEQKMNAYYIANVWRLGLRLPSSPDLPLSRNMVANQIRALFGNEPQAIDVRRRLATVRGAALAALSPSGASNASFRLFVKDMQRRARSCSSCASPPLPLLNGYDTNLSLTSLEELVAECKKEALIASSDIDTSNVLRRVFYGGSSFAVLSKLLLLYVAPNWLFCFPKEARNCLFDDFFTLAPSREALLLLVPTLTPSYSSYDNVNIDQNVSCFQAERLLVQCLIPEDGVKQMAFSFARLPKKTKDPMVVTMVTKSKSQKTIEQNILHVAQLISSIPDRARADAPSALHSPTFFQSVTTQMLSATKEHWEQNFNTLTANVEQMRDTIFIFVGEVFAKICRRGHADIITSEVLSMLLKDIPEIRTGCNSMCPSDSPQKMGSNFWSLLIASMQNDSHTLERWTKVLLLDMAQRSLLDSEASYILRTLFGNLVIKSHYIREMFTEQFLFWNVLPICCLKWVLKFSVISSPPSLEHSSELKPSSPNVQNKVVRHIAEVWSKKTFIRSATMEQQMYLTAALGICLGAMTKEEINSTGNLLHYLLEGISSRLDSPLPQVRRMAKQVALAFSVVIDPSNPLLLDDEHDIKDLSNFEDLKSEGVKNIVLQPSVALVGSVGNEKTRSAEKHFETAVRHIDNEIELKEGRIRRKEQEKRLASEEDDPDAIVDLAMMTYNSRSDEDSEDSVDTDNESDSSLQPYDISDDESDLERANFPSQLSQCAADLRKRDNPDAVEKALDVLEKLVRAKPDELENSAVDLAHALVHVHCSSIAIEGEEESVERKRHQALVALLVCSPLATVAVLTKELFSAHVDVSQRLLILDVLADSAQELSKTGDPIDSGDLTSRNEVKNILWASNSLAWYGPGGSHRRGAGPWKEISFLETVSTSLPLSHIYERELPRRPGQKRVGKSRKWANRSMELQQEKRDMSQNKHGSRRNRFAPLAASFMLPVMCEYDKLRHGVDLLGRDFIVLGQLIHMLGVCMECIALQPEAPGLGAAVLDMLQSRPIASHPESYVRRSVLYAASRILISLHPSAVVNALKGGDATLVTGLEWIREWALQLADHDTDTDCSMMAMACVQLHAEMALQAKRSMDSEKINIHQSKGILSNKEPSIIMPFNVLV